jgi:hypothetical protein
LPLGAPNGFVWAAGVDGDAVAVVTSLTSPLALEL